MTVANCPSCGAPVAFAIGSSAVVVCTYCRSVVARTDRGVESHGIVAALIDTGSPLSVGATGKHRGKGFRITGRTQLRHPMGGVWDEWYAAFDDGPWGWLAEAQGRVYLTAKVGAEAPPLASLELGARVPSLDPNLVVAEIASAELISAEGELPWIPTPGYSYEYADLTGDENRFATIDYSEDPPAVFKGHELTYADLGLTETAVSQKRVAVAAMNCSNCGGALDLRAPDKTERVWCPNCGGGHDVTADGKLRFLRLLEGNRVEPVIPLGAKGTFDGVEYVVAGFMQRSVHFDIDYFWTEYLLYERQAGFRWLVHSDDHWSFVTPLRPGEVLDSSDKHNIAKLVYYKDKRYRLFQDATAKVTWVAGEFYWRVEKGEAADTVDYIAPPFGISKEVTHGKSREVAYSHARYVPVPEMESIFGVSLPRPRGIGPMQPFTGARLGIPYLTMVVLLIAVAIYLGATRPNRQVYNKLFDLQAEGSVDNASVVFGEPFQLSGDYNVAVDADADVDNSWVYIVADLVDESAGMLQTFEIPLEYYHGVDQGESWSEGNRSRRIYLPKPRKGTYVLRLESQWAEGKPAPRVNVSVREGVFRFLYLILALLGISILPFFAMIRQLSFESRRWADSAHSPFNAETSEDDDEE